MPRAHPFGRSGGRILAPALLAMVLVAGCGSAAPATTPSPTLAATPRPTPVPTRRPSIAPSVVPSAAAALPRTGRIDVASAGYGLTLPENWFRVDLTREDLQAFAKAGSQSLGTDATAQLSDQVASLVASGISLFAYRFADADAGLGTNLNVIVLPGLGLDLDTLERLNLGQLQGIVGPDVTIDHARETLPAGEAVRLAYIVPGSARTNGKA
ncbi:MAG TPA: hypothetical protein VID95_08005, partial [Candidatus Limnocylindrales bacterium]